MPGTPTMKEFAAQVQNRGIVGAARGEMNLVFMRDFYNIANIMLKTGVVLTQEAIFNDFPEGPDRKKRMDFLMLVAKTCAHIYKGVLESKPESCNALELLLNEAGSDPVKQEVYTVFCTCLSSTILSMPILIPNFGKALEDSPTTEAQMHSLYVATLAQLPVDQRRAISDMLTKLGEFKTTFNTAPLRKEVSGEIKEVIANGQQPLPPVPSDGSAEKV